MENLRSGTIRSYLGSYQLFLNFVTMERVQKGIVPEVEADVLRIFRNVSRRLKGWRKTVDLDTRPQRTERLLDECFKGLKNDDVDAFLQSKPMQDCKEVFTKAQDGSDITTLEMCKVRDYLICLTTIKTGTRPGALETVTLQHYNTMKRDDETDKPVLLVPDHKRGVAGPALIGLDSKLEELFKIYVQKICPKFGDRCANLFVTSDGLAFTKGTLCKRLPELWSRSWVRSDLRVTTTNIRKWIVTTCHEKKTRGAKFDEDIVRQGLCHSDKTAKSFYLRSGLTSVAAQAVEIIAMCTSKKSEETPVKSAPTPVAEWPANITTAETSDQPTSMRM